MDNQRGYGRDPGPGKPGPGPRRPVRDPMETRMAESLVVSLVVLPMALIRKMDYCMWCEHFHLIRLHTVRECLTSCSGTMKYPDKYWEFGWDVRGSMRIPEPGE